MMSLNQKDTRWSRNTLTLQLKKVPVVNKEDHADSVLGHERTYHKVQV